MRLKVYALAFILCLDISIAFVVKALRAKRSGASLNAHQDRSPFVEALVRAQPTLKHRFFFPGHAGSADGQNQLNSVFGESIYKYDLPELDELDNLHSPQGPLLEAQQLAAELFGASRTWFLVNGSTSGVLIALLSCIRLHQQRAFPSTQRSVVLMPRDSHKSAFSALTLAQNCDAVLLPCEQDDAFQVSLGTTIETVREALQQYDGRVSALLLTRPSYQGLMLNPGEMQAIVDLCHSYGVPVVVDEAHGAHIRFLESPLYQDALSCGADIAVQSTHKTLTSLTQSAMLHLGPRAFQFHVPKKSTAQVGVDIGADTVGSERASAQPYTTPEVESVVHAYFSALTTTSPSAILLASLDATRALFAGEGTKCVQQTADAVNRLRLRLRQEGVPFVRLLEDSVQVRQRGLLVDPLRLSVQLHDPAVLSTMDSTRFDDLLCDEYGLYCELNQPGCVTYAVPPLLSSLSVPSASAGDTNSKVSATAASSLRVLEEALLALARRHNGAQQVAEEYGTVEAMRPRPPSQLLGYVDTRYLHHPAKAVSVLAARAGAKSEDPNKALIRRVSAETVALYPPGIPLLVQGEVVTAAHLKALLELRRRVHAGRADSSRAAAAVSPGSEELGDSDGGRGLPSGTSVTGCADPLLNHLLVYIT